MTAPELDLAGIRRTPPWWRKWRTFVASSASVTMANFTDALASVYGDRSAFLLDKPIESSWFTGNVLSYRDLNRFVRRAADLLATLGVRHGDRIALATSNRIEIAIVEFGAQRLGAVPVPINYMLTRAEIRQLVERSGARVMVTDRSVFDGTLRETASLPTIEHWVMVTNKATPSGVHSFDTLMAEAGEERSPALVAPDDPAVIFFTAGTTGLPKGAVLTSGGLMSGFLRYARIAALTPTSTSHLALLVMPLAHTGGHQNLLIQLALARPCLVMGRFDPGAILDFIERYRCTMFAGIPAMYRMLLEAGARQRDLSSIRVWGGGGDAFPADLVDEFRRLTERRFGPLRRSAAFITGYGLAETAGQVSISITPYLAGGDACVGFFLPGVKWRLVDENGSDVAPGEVGELWLKTHGLMKSYWNDPEGTAKAVTPDGWFRTGDLLKRGHRFRHHFVAREKDMIKVGGYSVFPAEVERELSAHPDIERCVVVGMPHPTKGELPVAAVIRRDGAATTEDEILAWTDGRIAAYRRPRRIVFVDAIPENFAMKPLRRHVRSQLQAMGVTVESRGERERLATSDRTLLEAHRSLGGPGSARDGSDERRRARDRAPSKHREPTQ